MGVLCRIVTLLGVVNSAAAAAALDSDRACIYNPIEALCSSPANTICNRVDQSIFVGNGHTGLITTTTGGAASEDYSTFCDSDYHAYFGFVSELELYCQAAQSNVRPMLNGFRSRFTRGNTYTWGEVHGFRGGGGTQDNIQINHNIAGIDIWHQHRFGIIGIQFIYNSGAKSTLCGDTMGQLFHVDVQSKAGDKCQLKYMSGVDLATDDGDNQKGIYGLGLHFEC